MDVEKLRSDAEKLDWGSILSANSVDDKVELLNSLLEDLYDRHAPVRAIKMRHLPAPWLTDDIKALMHRKASSKCRFKCNPTDLNKDKYILARNRCNKACRDAQRRHIHESVQNGDPSGFRSGHSTVTALIKITDDIRWGMEKGELTVLTLLDFSNAFNTVDFDILLGILSSLNISPGAIGWFHSYLRGRRQRIRIEDSFSAWCSTNAGVPQGGVLSPLLFALFINGISQSISCSYHLYADDLQIYCQSPPQELHNAISRMNCDLNNISDWSKCHGLKVNPTKTQVVLVGSSRLKSKIDWLQLPLIAFDGVTIPFADKVKNLGIFIDSNLTWAPQIGEVSRKIFASSASLRRLRNFLPTATKISLAQTLLLPILDYADACYSDITEEQLNKLERLQNFCIRFIFGLRKFDHISEYRTKLKWLPIRLRRNAHILSLLYSVLFNPSTPAYLKERFVLKLHADNRPMRSSQRLLLELPTHTSEFYGNSFTVTAIRLWNSLPLEIHPEVKIVNTKSPNLPVIKGVKENKELSTALRRRRDRYERQAHHITQQQELLNISSNEDLIRFSDYCLRNKLQLNIKKCNIVNFTKNKNVFNYPYLLSSQLLTKVDSLRDLGVQLDCKLHLDEHINKIVNKAYKMYGFVMRSSIDFVHPSTYIYLYKTLIRSQLEYAVAIWNPYYAKYKDIIEKVQRKFLRAVHYRCAGSRLPYSELLQLYNLPSLESRRTLLSAMTLYNICHGRYNCTELTRLLSYEVPRTAQLRAVRRRRLFAAPGSNTNAGLRAPLRRMVDDYNTFFLGIDIFSSSHSKYKQEVLRILNNTNE
ncbi:unnamed protein product [Plutella xylostella]|nr:unnamed protein product [Plutella xylostella]